MCGDCGYWIVKVFDFFDFIGCIYSVDVDGVEGIKWMVEIDCYVEIVVLIFWVEGCVGLVSEIVKFLEL